MDTASNHKLNFIELYNNYDKDVMKTYCDEMIELNGFPCVLKRWTGNTAAQDPLYQDTLYNFTNDVQLYEPIHTHVYIDYNRLNSVLQAYGLVVEPNTSLMGMMKLCDCPKEDDIVELKSPYDGRLIKFVLGSTDIHKNIVYHVTLNIQYIEGRDYTKSR